MRSRVTRRWSWNRNPRQFTETISPVLMLILSVVLAHAVELAMRLALPEGTTAAGRMLFGSEQGLLLARSVIFSMYALVAALLTLRGQRKPVTRDTLRTPFSIQSFLVSPFVVLLSLGLNLVRLQTEWLQVSGALVALFACVWYVSARTAAYRAIAGGGLLRALSSVLAGFIATTAIVMLVVIAFLG